MDIPLQHTALLVVDMQNGFCHPDGSMKRVGHDTKMCIDAIGPCVELVELCRAASVPVIFTRFVYKADYSDGGFIIRNSPQLKEVGAIVEGSWDAEIVDGLKPTKADYIIDKNRPSSFFKTNLEEMLDGMAIENVIVCGVTTNCCVETTVRDASQRDYNTFVVADATGELEQIRHDVALRAMSFLFASVITVADIRASVPAKAA